MTLSRENLILTEIKLNQYRFSYEPSDEVTPSAEGLIEVDKDVTISGDNIEDPMFSETKLNGIDFVKIQVWDNEGFQDITETELGIMFINELEILIELELS